MRTAARRAMTAAAATALLAACGGSSDATSTAGVTVSDAWARPTPAGATTGAVYFTLDSGVDDLLVGASVSTSLAASTALHMTMADAASGDASMHEMGPLAVPEGQVVAFEPGGSHVMLIDLAQPLSAADTFQLTLDFEQAGAQVVTVEVRDEAP